VTDVTGVGPTVGWRRQDRPSDWNQLDPSDELPVDERAAARRAARRLFHLHCMACGRSSEPSRVPARAGRCPACGGTTLLELA
jgi:hypothetical protein